MAHSSYPPLGDFTTDRAVIKLAALALVIGALSAGVAGVLVWLIRAITNLAYFQRFSAGEVTPADNHLGWLAVLIPAVGGLIIGLMARYGSDKIRGHGIPEALEAILIGGSRMSPKVTILKPLSSAISIGTGGPFGAEGPIIMTGGALGSLVAQLFRFSSVERRILLAAGAAAGMAAIFNTPVAAVLLAVELLLFEWKPRSFIPVAVASAAAAALRGPLLGTGPMFGVTPHATLSWETLPWAAGLGLVVGVGAGLASLLVYGFEDLFHRLPVHWMWWPAIGGLAVGLGGMVDPRVLGVGYDLIHGLLRGELVGGALVGLLLVKAGVWAVALGSGTSGGVLAPLLILGGTLGALAAPYMPVGDTGLWALVGMAAMMSGAMRAPFTAVLFGLELTHDLNTLPLLLVGAMAAVVVTVLFMRRSILTEKVARRGYHIAYEYGVDPLQSRLVGEVMDHAPATVPATMQVSEYANRLAQGDPLLARRQGTPVIGADGRLAGIITRGDVLRALEHTPTGELTVLEAGRRELIVTYPDEPVQTAVAKMLRNDVGRLPVVSRTDPTQLVGYLGRTGVMEARLRGLEEEDVRESGWRRPAQPTAEQTE
ncbi:MAG: chloride channel protein [Anaerolineales bacterium]|nr:chloride channel protein [Anaerolineales bacterium]